MDRRSVRVHRTKNISRRRSRAVELVSVLRLKGLLLDVRELKLYKLLALLLVPQRGEEEETGEEDNDKLALWASFLLIC